MKAKIIFIILSLFLISSCGSGGDGSSDTNEAGGTEPPLEVNDSGFLKISQAGEVLPVTENQWDCVLDSNTELYWEIKKYDESDLQNGWWQYSMATPPDRDLPDYYDFGQCLKSISGDDNIYCNAFEYVEELNEIELCGFTDWRLPEKEELASIVRCYEDSTEPPLDQCGEGHITPALNSNFFPEFHAYTYWTNSRALEESDPEIPDYAYWYVSFENGYVSKTLSHSAIYVRAVRGE